jgi:hypothetical protein
VIEGNHLERNMDGVLLWRAGQGAGGAVEIHDNKVTGNKGSGIGVHSQSNAVPPLSYPSPSPRGHSVCGRSCDTTRSRRVARVASISATTPKASWKPIGSPDLAWPG